MAAARLTREAVQGRIVKAVQKAWGSDAAMLLGGGGARAQVRGVIPSGLEVLDGWVLGIGGWPCGRLVELSGEEGCGKSTLGYTTLAQVQALGGVAVLADTEHALHLERIKALGVDVESLILLQPDTLEDLLGQVEAVLREVPDGLLCAIVWDSVANTPTKAELEAGLGEKAGGGMAEFARVMSQNLKVLAPLLVSKNAVLLAVNQVRSKPGVSFGPDTQTTGGRALKYMASIRVQFLGGAKVKSNGDSGDVVGKDVLLECVKSRFAPPFRKVRARLMFTGGGWRNEWSTLGLAKDLGVVPENTKGKGAHRKALEALNARADFATMRKLQLPGDAQPAGVTATDPDSEE